MHVLVIEDDSVIASNIQRMLATANFTSTIASCGEDGIYQAEIESWDIIILDWMLPDLEGIEVCRQLRDKNISTPILMLTSRSQVEDKIQGLDNGADDYLTKPFSFDELLARVKALLRRPQVGHVSGTIAVSDLTINTNTHEVERAGNKIQLAPREYSLLEYLAVHKGIAIERIKLLHHVWGEEVDPLSNTIDVHVRYLRQKIDDSYPKKLLLTIKNKGYMLCGD